MCAARPAAACNPVDCCLLPTTPLRHLRLPTTALFGTPIYVVNDNACRGWAGGSSSRLEGGTTEGWLAIVPGNRMRCGRVAKGSEGKRRGKLEPMLLDGTVHRMCFGGSRVRGEGGKRVLYFGKSGGAELRERTGGRRGDTRGMPGAGGEVWMRMVTCRRVPGGGTPGQLTGWGNRCGGVQSSGWGKAKNRADWYRGGAQRCRSTLIIIITLHRWPLRDLDRGW